MACERCYHWWVRGFSTANEVLTGWELAMTETARAELSMAATMCSRSGTS